jgi:beta-glucosidase
MAAAEVAQLYLHIPGGPERVLRGFEKKFLQPGEEVEVTFELNRRDMSSWDVVKQAWVLQSGTYGVMVGKSVGDIQLRGSLRV